MDIWTASVARTLTTAVGLIFGFGFAIEACAAVVASRAGTIPPLNGYLLELCLATSAITVAVGVSRSWRRPGLKPLLLPLVVALTVNVAGAIASMAWRG